MRKRKNLKINRLIFIPLTLLILANSFLGIQEPVNVSSSDYKLCERALLWCTSFCAYPKFEFVPVKPGDTWSQLFPPMSASVKWLSALTEPILLSSRSWIVVVPTNLSEINYLDFCHRFQLLSSEVIKN